MHHFFFPKSFEKADVTADLTLHWFKNWDGERQKKDRQTQAKTEGGKARQRKEGGGGFEEPFLE